MTNRSSKILICTKEGSIDSAAQLIDGTDRLIMHNIPSLVAQTILTARWVREGREEKIVW